MSEVFFTDFRTSRPDQSQLSKLRRLIDVAGMGKIDFRNKYVAIKIHFGEPGNLAYLRPQWARVVADYIRERGGKPFLTDCNTLYTGRRKDALEHLTSAEENGYSYVTTGCRNIVADGLKGTDEALIPIGGEYVKEAKIGRALADADIIISLNHFKGHEAAGFGGALKNLGMGGGSRAGKMEMHSASKPAIDTSLCIRCGACRKGCAHGAMQLGEKYAEIDYDKCVGCGHCIGLCNQDAISAEQDESTTVLSKKIAEYTKAVLQDKPAFHISLVMDVSPKCDCWGGNDAPIVPDIGMFASFDPVALDAACADAVLAAPVMEKSAGGECRCADKDIFTAIHPVVDWRAQLTHGEKIGLGEMKYTLKTV